VSWIDRARWQRPAQRLLVAAILWGALVGTARAQEPAPRFVRLVFLRGHGAQSCPDADGFETAVSARLQRFPFSEVADDLLVVLVERVPSAGFRGRLFLRSDDGISTGERQLRLQSCAELVDALAVATGVLLAPPAIALASTPAPAAAEPDAGREGQEPPPVASLPLAPAATPPAGPTDEGKAAELTATRETAQVSSPVAWSRATWQLGVGPLMAFDPTGQADPGAGASVALGRLWSRFALLGELRGLREQTRSQGRGSVGAFTLLGGVTPCWRPGPSLVCASVNAGVVRAGASGYDDSRSAWRPSVAAGLRYGYELGRGRIRFRPNLWAEASLLRWRFTVDDAVVLRQSRFTLGAGVELLAHFL
jgi:hypothetical protein